MVLTYDRPRSELVKFVPASTRRLLDVGCGAGGYGAEIAKVIPGVELWGIEPDRDHFEQARQHFATIIQGQFPDTADQVPQAAFDVVTFNDVLEHMLEPGDALDAVKPILGSGGKVIASIPNIRHRSVTWPLMVRARWDYEQTGLLDRTHLRFFTRATMRELFEQRGWRVLSCEGVNSRWHWADGRERRLVRWLRRVSRNRLDDFFFVQYVITAEPL